MTFEWYVFMEDFNRREIVKFNVFDSVKFRRGLLGIKKKLKKDPALDLKEELKSELMYCFWSKCEYEIVIGSLFAKDDNDYEKIDVYDQVMLNFDAFYNYVVSILPKIKDKK